MVLTLAAALPSASNVWALAERYGTDNDRIVRIIIVSTVLSFLTPKQCGLVAAGLLSSATRGGSQITYNSCLDP